ncbi:hypothetical protein [Bradyrhizobium sp. USDA 10063]
MPLRQAKEEDRQALKAANGRIAAQRIELGRKLAALRDATPNNKRFGRLVRERFDLNDPQDAGEMRRVASLYGDRPEIFRNVSWHILAQPASSATSEARCRKFGAKIVAGERVNGAEIIHARQQNPV